MIFHCCHPFSYYFPSQMHQLLGLLAATAAIFLSSPFSHLFHSGGKITYFAISLELLIHLDWNFVWVQGLATGCHTPNFSLYGWRMKRYWVVQLTWKWYFCLGIQCNSRHISFRQLTKLIYRCWRGPGTYTRVFIWAIWLLNSGWDQLFFHEFQAQNCFTFA